MTDLTTELKTRKKRPPKLSPLPQADSDETLCIATASSQRNSNGSKNSTNSCVYDSTVKVDVNDLKDILISPDDLHVIKQLGRGQYGIVEQVLHQKSGCQFAVKRVSLKQHDDNERLLMDVDILVKGTECKNIIKFFGALIWEGDLWILMELMDCSLDKFYKLAHRKVCTPILSLNEPRVQPSVPQPCKHDGVQIGNCEICNPIPEPVLGRMSAEILNALSYLYSIKVIHRDIKPSNILINQIGIIKLCDFGISGYLVNSVARTYEAGCRPYMAPERIDPPRDRAGYDIKSDVWSFGITMFEISTGRYPYYQARGFFEQLKSICSDEPPKLPDGKFSPQFEDFISQCLRKDYSSRPKYDTLQIHPFIESYKNLDIKSFSEKVLSRQ